MGVRHSTLQSCDKILWAKRKQELDLRRSGEIRQSSCSQRKMLTPSIPPERVEEVLGKEIDLNALREFLKYNNNGEAPPLNEEAVLKINVTLQGPDWTIPWQRLDVEFARGSGAVIEGGFVLTAAHVVANYTFVELEKTTIPRKCPAKVVGICNDLDLALLKPVDEDFLKGVTPLKIGEMPSLRQRIYVAGFPIGGEEISVTEGVVSRIEVQPYSHSLKVALAVTVDAAINSGNSGGPVMNQKGELIGIAFQALEGAEAIGHIVPPAVIKHFLHGIKTFGPEYRGYPDLGIVTQPLENPTIRQYLGMTNEQSGVRVVKVLPENTCHNILKEGDVIMKIDNYVISNNGIITFDNRLHGDFNLAVQQKYAGDTLNLTILRDKQVMEVQVKLAYLKEIVPSHQYNVHPPYFVYLGLLFQPLSLDVLQSHFAGNLLAAPQVNGFIVSSRCTFLTLE